MSKEESRFVDFQQERLEKIRIYKYGWKNLEEKFIEPLQAREGSSFTFVPHSGSGTEPHSGVAYLIGGVGEKIANKVHLLDIASEKWTEIATVSKEIGNFRFNHSAVFYEGKIYLFAGETIDHSNFTSRTLLNDVRILDLSSLIWSSIAHS